MSLQSDAQAAIRAITGTASQWTGDWHALFDLHSLAQGSWAGRIVAYYRKVVADDASVTAGAALMYFLKNPSAIVAANFSLSFLQSAIPSSLAFTRSGNAWYFNSSGDLTVAGNNVARMDYNPTTLAARGLLVEQARTNSLRNNSGTGASAGTPGTLPTNWSAALPAGITQQVVGTGTENGIPYLDVRFSGTTGDANRISILLETTTGVAAANAQMWTVSSFIRVVAGAMPGGATDLAFIVQELDAGGGVLAANTGPGFTPATTALRQNRVAYPFKTTQATTANLRPILQHIVGSGVALDFTLRIGAPQLEQGGGLGDSDVGAYHTSPILTTGSAVTRNEESPSLSPFSLMGYNQPQGAMLVDVELGTVMRADANAIISLEADFNNRIQMRRDANDRIIRYQGGATSIFAYGGEWDVPGPVKYACSYGTRLLSAWNGIDGFDDVTADVPTCTGLFFGFGSGSNRGSLWIRSFTYFPTSKTMAELEALTAP